MNKQQNFSHPTVQLKKCFSESKGMRRTQARTQSQKKYYLSVQINVRDEDFWLPEWICYYLLMKVDHFYIYDHVSKNPVKNLLKPVEKFCTIIRSPLAWKKPDFRNHFFQNYAQETEWVLLLDSDEFAIPKKSKNLKEFISRFDSPRQRADEVSANWIMFDHQDIEKKTDGFLALEQFTRKSKELNEHVKSFVRTSARISYQTPHHEIVRGLVRDSAGNVRQSNWFTSPIIGFSGNRQPLQSNEYLVIHHYYTRTKEDWAKKFNGIRDDTGTRRIKNQNFNYSDGIIDDSAKKFVPAVKNLIKFYFEKYIDDYEKE